MTFKRILFSFLRLLCISTYRCWWFASSSCGDSLVEKPIVFAFWTRFPCLEMFSFSIQVCVALGPKPLASAPSALLMVSACYGAYCNLILCSSRTYPSWRAKKKKTGAPNSYAYLVQCSTWSSQKPPGRVTRQADAFVGIRKSQVFQVVLFCPHINPKTSLATISWAVALSKVHQINKTI